MPETGLRQGYPPAVVASNGAQATFRFPLLQKKGAGGCVRRQARKRFRRPAAIGPGIGRLQGDFRLGRNRPRGIGADAINLRLASELGRLRRVSSCLDAVTARLRPTLDLNGPLLLHAATPDFSGTARLGAT